jgi:hypothetical protein
VLLIEQPLGLSQHLTDQIGAAHRLAGLLLECGDGGIVPEFRAEHGQFDQCILKLLLRDQRASIGELRLQPHLPLRLRFLGLRALQPQFEQHGIVALGPQLLHHGDGLIEGLFRQ